LLYVAGGEAKAGAGVEQTYMGLTLRACKPRKIAFMA